MKKIINRVIMVICLSLVLLVTSCKPKEFEVNFNVDGTITSIMVEKDQTILEFPDTLREGYAFNGWYKDASFSVKFDEKQKVTSDMTLFASYTKLHTVTYHADEVYTESVKDGCMVTKIQELAKEGYNFMGWFLDANHTNSFDETLPITSDIDLYPLFTRITFKISFNTDGGTSMRDISINYGQVYREPVDPFKFEYKFKYWAIDPAGDNKYDFTGKVYEDLTLYAIYEKISYENIIEEFLPDVVSDNVEFPNQYEGAELEWSSSNKNVLTDYGIFLPSSKDQTVTITLTVKDINSTKQLKFFKTVIVKGYRLKNLVYGDIVVGYTSSWYYSGYSEEVLETVDILNMSFAYVNEDSTLDMSGLTGMLPGVVTTAHQAGVRVCLSIQGYGAATENFSQSAANPATRVKLASSMVEMVKKYNFDGIDIDWEYPGMASIQLSTDRVNYTLLIAEIRKQLDAYEPGLILSAAIPAGPWGSSRFEMTKLCQYFDFINMMSYDLQSSSVGSHHSALYPSSYSLGTYKGCSVEETCKAWKELGVPSNKILIGLAFYGKSIYVNSDKNNGIGSTKSSTITTDYKNSTYKVIMDDQLSKIGGTSTYFFDRSAMAPTILNSAKRFYTYENEESVLWKCAYAKEGGYAGVMIWEIGEDPTSKLITSVAQGMQKHLDGKPYIIGGKITLNINEQITISPVYEVSGSALKNSVKIEVSDSAVATISGNTLTAKKAGNVSVKVLSTDGTCYGELLITIK